MLYIRTKPLKCKFLLSHRREYALRYRNIAAAADVRTEDEWEYVREIPIGYTLFFYLSIKIQTQYFYF